MSELRDKLALLKAKIADLKSNDLEKVADDESSRFHGWISPEGKYHHMEPHENHHEVIHDISDRDDNEHAYESGWVSVGHGGAPNAEGHVLSDPSHPATRTLRQMVREHHAGSSFDIDLRQGAEGFMSVDPDSFARHGRLLHHETRKPMQMKKSELEKSKKLAPKKTERSGGGGIYEDAVRTNYKRGFANAKPHYLGEVGDVHVMIATHPDHGNLIGSHHHVEDHHGVERALDDASSKGFRTLILHGPKAHEIGAQLSLPALKKGMTYADLEKAKIFDLKTREKLADLPSTESPRTAHIFENVNGEKVIRPRADKYLELQARSKKAKKRTAKKSPSLKKGLSYSDLERREMLLKSDRLRQAYSELHGILFDLESKHSHHSKPDSQGGTLHVFGGYGHAPTTGRLHVSGAVKHEKMAPNPGYSEQLKVGSASTADHKAIDAEFRDRFHATMQKHGAKLAPATMNKPWERYELDGHEIHAKFEPQADYRSAKSFGSTGFMVRPIDGREVKRFSVDAPAAPKKP